jgi:hypothetical protein
MTSTCTPDMTTPDMTTPDISTRRMKVMASTGDTPGTAVG